MIVTPSNVATMRHILGIETAAAERPRSGDNGAVPVGELVPRLDLQRRVEDCQGNVLYRKSGPRGDQAHRELVRQRFGSGRPRYLRVELLQDLD